MNIEIDDWIANFSYEQNIYEYIQNFLLICSNNYKFLRFIRFMS
jgi:hypothetical protein